MKTNINKLIERLDDNHVKVKHPYGFDATIIANSKVPIEVDGIEQLLSFLSLDDTLKEIADNGAWGEHRASIDQVVVTPDFHRGGGIPIGTVALTSGCVIPSAVGNDICCGMRLLVLDITDEELNRYLDKLEPRLRSIFFGGERDIPMSPGQRTALMTGGLSGLHAVSGENANKGLWQYYNKIQQGKDLQKVNHAGNVTNNNVLDLFKDFIKGSGATDSRDSQIGSIGGGNHFVEIQSVKEVFDGATAYDWGLNKNYVTLMIHSGSVSLGHVVGGFFGDEAKRIFPSNMRKPNHGFYVLPTVGEHADLGKRYLNAMNAAGNFAFGNRLFLGLMAVRAVSEIVGRNIGHKLVYDTPHNLIWELADGSYLHRKGACPALGMEQAIGTPFAYTGFPVIIPGSMGASSFVLSGMGNADMLCSASHGAGRSLTRGEAIHFDEDKFNEAMKPIRVVTPIDPKNQAVALRRDIMAKYKERLKEEAPFAYKPITPIIDSIEGANVASKVARLWPIMTVKG